MRKPGKWMKSPDPYILEYLQEEGPAAPKDLYDDGRLPFSRGYINSRMQKLADKEFVQNIGRGLYQIDERGEEFLKGEFDASELDPPGNAEKAAV